MRFKFRIVISLTERMRQEMADLFCQRPRILSVCWLTLSLKLCAMKTQEPGNEPSQVIPLCKDVKVSSLQYPNVSLSKVNEERLLSFVT